MDTDEFNATAAEKKATDPEKAIATKSGTDNTKAGKAAKSTCSLSEPYGKAAKSTTSSSSSSSGKSK